MVDAICIFRSGIRPEWEDTRNKQGGELQFEVDGKYINKFDIFYRDLVLEVLGASNPMTKRVGH